MTTIELFRRIIIQWLLFFFDLSMLRKLKIVNWTEVFHHHIRKSYKKYFWLFELYTGISQWLEWLTWINFSRTTKISRRDISNSENIRIAAYLMNSNIVDRELIVSTVSSTQKNWMIVFVIFLRCRWRKTCACKNADMTSRFQSSILLYTIW